MGFVRDRRKHREFNRRFDDGAIVLTVELPRDNECSVENVKKAMARLQIPGFDVAKFLAGGYSDIEIELKVTVRGCDVCFAEQSELGQVES